MFPVEAPKDLTLRILHRLGHQQYIITLHLHRGDDVKTKVLQVFQHGQLPGCFYRPTLEYTVLAARESLSSVSIPMSTDVLGSKSSSAFLTCLLPERASYDWPLLTCSKTSERDLKFWYAYDFLLRHRPGFFRTIGTLEESYLKGIHELQEGRVAAISSLQQCQSTEMEKVRRDAELAAHEKGNLQHVQVLVAQHVGELDRVESHWRTEIEQLKVWQRASYMDLVIDFFDQEMEQLRCRRDESADLALSSALAPVSTAGEEDRRPGKTIGVSDTAVSAALRMTSRPP